MMGKQLQRFHHIERIYFDSDESDFATQIEFRQFPEGFGQELFRCR